MNSPKRRSHAGPQTLVVWKNEAAAARRYEARCPTTPRVPNRASRTKAKLAVFQVTQATMDQLRGRADDVPAR